jgi:hypothetical protein
MPLNSRKIALKTACLAFLAFGLIGSAAGVQPFVCCKRALAAAALVFFAASVTVKIINHFVFQIIVSHYIKRQTEQVNED